MHPQIIKQPTFFTVWWTCWGPTRSPSQIQYHDLPYECNPFIFVSSSKGMHFQSSMVQFSYLWANSTRARTCLQIRNGFVCCTCAPNPTSLKAHLTMISNKKFTCFKSELFCCHRCISESTFHNKSDTTPLLLVWKKLLHILMYKKIFSSNYTMFMAISSMDEQQKIWSLLLSLVLVPSLESFLSSWYLDFRIIFSMRWAPNFFLHLHATKILANTSDLKMMTFKSGTYWLNENWVGIWLIVLHKEKKVLASSTHMKCSSQCDIPCTREREREGTITYKCTCYSSYLEALK